MPGTVILRNSVKPSIKHFPHRDRDAARYQLLTLNAGRENVGHTMKKLSALAVLSLAMCLTARSQNTNASVAPTPILIPSASWNCGMPDGIPVPESGTLVFTATLKCESHDLGTTPFGKRKVCVITEGSRTGGKLDATVMSGGLDFELTLANGTKELEQVMVLKTGDGKFIYLRTMGAAADSDDVRMIADFEAPTASSHSWINSGRYVGRRQLDAAAHSMTLSVFDVTSVTNSLNTANAIHVKKPEGIPNQPLDFRHAAQSEKRGDTIVTEEVSLGAGQSVGATKNGARNIIPITGGTLHGKISGKVLAGGADYQHLGNPTTLDARYLWQTDDGEVIIVRNGGPISSLAPMFEASVDGKCAWLNSGKYLSSPPSMRAGAVALTFYESKE